ncbi:MAG: prephenate dehydrogenase/arogenate dehydrogenase family protein, partial [Clostridia bacterium]|nr:prephenate dehydrogenase/arogenate dehydrogenase family protein [Clostridia bacterium]
MVGLGVIGGGYAKALSKKGYKVKCITRKQSDIDYALAHDMVIGGSPFPDPELIKEADLIVVALYPQAFIDWVKDYQKHMHRGAIVTDVTGVKGGIVHEVQSFLRDDIEFIAAHPMAGRERSGIEFSDDKVFQGANFIVTPTEKNTKDAIDVCKKLGAELGFAKISELTPEEHDAMIAFLSQLTHVIAVTLMTCNTKDGLEKSQYLSKYGRDLVKMARDGKIDPVIGRDGETERVIQILSRRTKNNPCLIGEPGVGKTAVAEGLAKRIAEGNVPESLADKVIVSLDITSMLAGSKYR